MQYLLKLQIQNTRAWRLIAVDGEYSLAKLMKIVSLSFCLENCASELTIFDKIYKTEHECPVAGDEFLQFDSLSLAQSDEFTFSLKSLGFLAFKATVLKKDVHLDCLMPSLLAGVGPVNSTEFKSLESFNEYLESDDALELDCKSITKKIREFSLQKENISEAMIKAGADILNYKVK